jgi:hypothetical protein
MPQVGRCRGGFVAVLGVGVFERAAFAESWAFADGLDFSAGFEAEVEREAAVPRDLAPLAPRPEVLDTFALAFLLGFAADFPAARAVDRAEELRAFGVSLIDEPSRNGPPSAAEGRSSEGDSSDSPRRPQSGSSGTGQLSTPDGRVLSRS